MAAFALRVSMRRNEEEGDEMKAIKLNNVKDEKPEFEIVKLFSGYKLPVMLVSNK
jgi:hypothetical protein